jgi:hypothetical protein
MNQNLPRSLGNAIWTLSTVVKETASEWSVTVDGTGIKE